MKITGGILILIGMVIMGCQGHQMSLERKQTVVVNLQPSPEQQFEGSQLESWFQSWGISRQESFTQQGTKYERAVSYAATVPSAQRAKHMIRKITTTLPQFIDNDDRQVIEDVIDTATAEARQKREAPATLLELQVNYQSVQFFLTIREDFTTVSPTRLA